MLAEAQESDDNQETVLEKLEDSYNINHRSNIYVTGTISVVINSLNSLQGNSKLG